MLSTGVILGLISALAFGILDALIAFVSRTLNVLHSIVLAQIISVLVLIEEIVAVEKQGFSLQWERSSFLLVVVIGLANSLANLCLYKGLDRGPVALVSPIAASYGVMTTILSASILRQTLTLGQYVAVTLVLGGVIFCSLDLSTRKLSDLPTKVASRIAVAMPTLSVTNTIPLLATGNRGLSPSWLWKWYTQFFQKYLGVLCGLGAMVGFGIEFFSLSLASHTLGPVQPLVWSRLFSAIFIFIYACLQDVGGWGEIKLKHLGLIASLGILDIVGMWAYDRGTLYAAAGIVASLSSTYTILPIVFGVIVYRERLALPQWLGMSALLIGIVVLARVT